MAKLTLNEITSGYGSASLFNANNTAIETAIENTLSRDGTGPNQMGADLDMNTNRVKNLAEPVAGADAVRLSDLQAATVNTPLPDTTGHEGEFLQVSGGAAIWDAFTASDVPFTPAGTIAASTLQAAIEELDTETQASLALKLAKASNLSDVDNAQTAADNLTGGAAVAASVSKSADYAISRNSSNVAKRVLWENIIRYEEVRQSVVAGAVDSSGQANFISAGTGLACNLAATTTPVVISFAAGEDENGPVNYRKRIAADASSFVSSLAATNRSFIYADRDTGTGALTYGKTLIPPQYDYAFDKARQSLLRFPGGDTSTIILDDYGNTWTAYGDAQVDTGVTIDGENTLLLDGTGDYVDSANFATLGSGWTVEFKIRWSSLVALQDLFHATNGSGYGVQLRKQAGTGTSMLYLLSSNGTSWDITGGTAGTKTSWATATDYHMAFCHDPIAGKYYAYVDGVKDAEITSTALINALTKFVLGAASGGANGVSGSVAGFRFSPFCRYPNGTTFTPPTLPFSVEGDYFDIPSMKMYTVTSASASAGTNPGMTQKHRVYMGEAVTDASSVTSAITYALKDQWIAAWTNTFPSHNTTTSVNHYLASHQFAKVKLDVECLTADSQYTPGDKLRDNQPIQVSGSAYSPLGLWIGRRTAGFTCAAGANLQIFGKTTPGIAAMTYASWKYRLRAERGW